VQRTHLLSLVVAVALITVAGRGLVAQQPASGPNVAGIEKVEDNLYMVTGGGGNTAEQAAAELTLPVMFKDYAMTRTRDNVATIYKQLP